MSRRLAVVAALIICACAPLTARADEPAIYYISGVVLDPVGRPLSSAAVNDGHQTVLTAADGTYRLPERNPATYTIDMFRSDTVTYSVIVDETIPVDRQVDGTLQYRIIGSYEDPSPAPGATATLSLHVKAPAADASGLCVVVLDPQTPSPMAASFVAPASDVGSLWTVDVPTSVDRPEGFDSGEYYAARCSDGTHLTVTASAPLYIDRTTPVIDFVDAMVPGAAIIEAPARDRGVVPVGIDPTTTAVEIDGVVIPSEYDETAELVRFAAPESSGEYAVTVAVEDYSGNAAIVFGTLTVDASPPEELDHQPTGSSAATTPRISATLADDGAGLNASGLTMCLSNAQRSNLLRAQLAPGGEYSYQVPTIPAGVGLGESPLPDGRYSVTVEAQDNVGNRMASSWSFEVAGGTTSPVSLPVLGRGCH